jgi:hypothetical protein
MLARRVSGIQRGLSGCSGPDSRAARDDLGVFFFFFFHQFDSAMQAASEAQKAQKGIRQVQILSQKKSV